MLGAGEGRLKQHYKAKLSEEPVGCTLPVIVDMANFTSSAPPGSGIVFFLSSDQDLESLFSLIVSLKYFFEVFIVRTWAWAYLFLI